MGSEDICNPKKLSVTHLVNNKGLRDASASKKDMDKWGKSYKNVAQQC